MKTAQSTSQLALSFSLILLFFLSGLTAQAQTFYLKDIVLGNKYAPNSTSFNYETPWYYDWSIKNNRANSWGGDLELHVTLKSKPNCKKIYKVTWTFSKDIRMVSCGEKIFIDVVNQPISGGDCGWDWVEHNPSSLALKTGASGMTYAEAKKDPKSSYREYVFLHHPGHVVRGEAQYIDNKFSHLHHAERLEIVVCSRPDMAAIANGGNFHFNFDGRGVFFDIDYLFSKESATPLPPLSASLQNPIIQHNIQSSGSYWMGIQLPGVLQGYAGKQIQIAIRFVDANGNFLPGNLNDPRYIDASGYAATGSGLISVTSDQFDLGSMQLWMPYYALNLLNTGGQQVHNLNAFAEVFTDGKMVAQSKMVPLQVTW